MPKIWVGRTTLDGEKTEDGLSGKGSVSPNGGGEMVPISSVAETYNKGSILSHNVIVHRFLITLQFSQARLIIYSM